MIFFFKPIYKIVGMNAFQNHPLAMIGWKIQSELKIVKTIERREK